MGLWQVEEGSSLKLSQNCSCSGYVFPAQDERSMLELQIQFAVTFEPFELAFWNSELASALKRSIRWCEVQKLVLLVDSNGVPLKKIGIFQSIFVCKRKKIFFSFLELSCKLIIIELFLNYLRWPRPPQPGLSRPRCWTMLWRRSRPPPTAPGPLGPPLTSGWIGLWTGTDGICLHWRWLDTNFFFGLHANCYIDGFSTSF